MTARVLASAPGKIVLAGEYAVLDGAPAIAMAVNRRAQIVLEHIDGEVSEVRAPDYTDEVGHFRMTESGVLWEVGQAAFALVDAALNAVDLDRQTAMSLQLDTAAFTDAKTKKKTGIGSSAALAVALCAALKESTDVAAVARRAHAALQGGAGSGVDVACSVTGGLIEYCMQGWANRRLDWPDKLFYRLIWTGISASTREQLGKLDVGLSKPSRVRLASASESMAKVWASGDAGRLLAEYQSYCEALFRFSVDHDLGIFDAGHEELWRAATADNLVYKPCGAGGGDIGIVFGTNETALAAFVNKLPTKYTILDCELTTTGVCMDKSPADPATAERR